MTVPATTTEDSFSPRWLRPFVGRPADVAALAWGFAEATFFILVPDILVTFIALFAVRRSIRAMALVTFGAVLGGALMFAWSSRGPAAANAVSRVPAVTSAMFRRVDADFAVHGINGIFRGPMSGIPYKIYAVEAPGRVSLGSFIVASVPARLERFLIAWPPYALLGFWLRQRRVRPNWLIVIWALHWTTVYLFYWGIV